MLHEHDVVNSGPIWSKRDNEAEYALRCGYLVIVKCLPGHVCRFSDPIGTEEQQFVYSPAPPSWQNMVSFDSKAIGDVPMVYTLQYLQIT